METRSVDATAAYGPRREVYEKTYGGFSVDVYLLPRHRTMVYEMEGFIMPNHTHEFLDDLLAAAKRHRPYGMIADPRRMRVLNDDFQRAVQTRFWPEIARLGVRKNPAIDPTGLITRASVRQMVKAAQEATSAGGDAETLDIAILGSLEECLAFIAQPGAASQS
jgi:hypothetical protein